MVEVAMAYQGIADVYQTMGTSGKIGPAAEQALAAWDTLVRAHPHRRDFRHHLAQAHHTRALQLRFVRRPEESLREFERAGGALGIPRSRKHWPRRLPHRPAPGTRSRWRPSSRSSDAATSPSERSGTPATSTTASGGRPEVPPEDRQAFASCLFYIAEALCPAGRIDEATAYLARCRDLVDGLLREQPTYLDFLVIRAKVDSQTGALSGTEAAYLRPWMPFAAPRSVSPSSSPPSPWWTN